MTIEEAISKYDTLLDLLTVVETAILRLKLKHLKQLELPKAVADASLKAGSECSMLISEKNQIVHNTVYFNSDAVDKALKAHEECITNISKSLLAELLRGYTTMSNETSNNEKRNSVETILNAIKKIASEANLSSINKKFFDDLDALILALKMHIGHVSHAEDIEGLVDQIKITSESDDPNFTDKVGVFNLYKDSIIYNVTVYAKETNV